jgi:hypothetical protein
MRPQLRRDVVQLGIRLDVIAQLQLARGCLKVEGVERFESIHGSFLPAHTDCKSGSSSARCLISRTLPSLNRMSSHSSIDAGWIEKTVTESKHFQPGKKCR